MGRKAGHRLLLLSVLGSSFLVAFDASALEAILPKLAAQLGMKMQLAVFLVSGYFLAMNAALPVAGALGDRWSKGRLYASGAILFALASILCAAAPGAEWLIAGRLAQGIAAALAGAVGAALLVEHLAPEERGRAFAAVATAVGMGYIVGPSVGGFMFDWLGWRWIFLINVPISIAIVGSVSSFLATSTTGDTGRAKVPFDFFGAVSIVALVVSLSLLTQTAFVREPHVWLPWLALLVGSGAGLIWSNRKAPQPVFDFSLFADNLPFAFTNVLGFSSFVGAYLIAIGMPFYISTVLGLSASSLGALLTAFPIGFLLASPAGAWLERKASGVKGVLLAQGAIVCGTALLLLMDFDTAHAAVAAVSFLVGIGRGLFIAPYNTFAMGLVGPHQLGVGASTLGLTRNLGMMFGTSVAGVLLALTIGDVSATANRSSPVPVETFMHGLRTVFLAAIIASVFALLAGAAAAVAHLRRPELQ